MKLDPNKRYRYASQSVHAEVEVVRIEPRGEHFRVVGRYRDTNMSHGTTSKADGKNLYDLPTYDIIPLYPDLSHLKEGDEIAVRVRFYKQSATPDHVVVTAIGDHTSSARLPISAVCEFPPPPPKPEPLVEGDDVKFAEGLSYDNDKGRVVSVWGDILWVKFEKELVPLTYRRELLVRVA